MKNVILFGKNSSIGEVILNRYKVVLALDRAWPGFSDELTTSLDFVDKLDKDLHYTVVYCSSILYSKNFGEQTNKEIHDSFHVNTVVPIKILRRFNNSSGLKFNFHYIGSESAKKGSYDCSYAMTKNATQDYVTSYRLNNAKSRSLVWAPSTMSKGMTARREDVDRVNSIRSSLRNKRFLEPEELVKMINLLNGKEFQYLSNTLIEVNDGKFSKLR